MKTIKQWLETLPEPYRSQALENWDGESRKVKSSSAAIGSAFKWWKSPEGIKYWENFYYLLSKQDREDKLSMAKLSNRELAETIYSEIKWMGGDSDNEPIEAIEQILNQHR